MSLKIVPRKGTTNWYLRGNVRGQPIFESTGTDDREAAEAIRIKREGLALETSIHGKKATATFLEAAVSYMATGAPVRFIGKEVDGKWTGLIGYFQARRLRTITQQDLDNAALLLYPNCSPESRNRQCYTPFVSIWRHAVRQQWAEAREWARPRKAKGTLHKLKRGRAGTTPTTYEHVAPFIAAMSPAPGLVMTALFYTGMRPIELFALDWNEDDIRPDDRWLVLSSSKNGEPRGIPIHEFLVPIFKAFRPRGGRVFRTPSGEPYPLFENSGGQIKSAIAGAAKRSGVKGISPYTARHTVSTQLVVNGVHPHIKDQILGHAVTDMSRHYTHVPQANLIDAINTLPVPDHWRKIEWIAAPMEAKPLVRNSVFRAKSVHVDTKTNETPYAIKEPVNS